MATTQTRRWKPSFPERWRHGGWYTNNRYDNGAVGCVHNNHVDCPGKRWFVAGLEDELGGFSTRTEAAYAERCMMLEDRLAEMLAALRLAIPVIEYAEVDSAAEGLDAAHAKIVDALNAARAVIAKAQV